MSRPAMRRRRFDRASPRRHPWPPQALLRTCPPPRVGNRAQRAQIRPRGSPGRGRGGLVLPRTIPPNRAVRGCREGGVDWPRWGRGPRPGERGTLAARAAPSGSGRSPGRSTRTPRQPSPTGPSRPVRPPRGCAPARRRTGAGWPCCRPYPIATGWPSRVREAPRSDVLGSPRGCPSSPPRDRPPSTSDPPGARPWRRPPRRCRDGCRAAGTACRWQGRTGTRGPVSPGRRLPRPSGQSVARPKARPRSSPRRGAPRRVAGFDLPCRDRRHWPGTLSAHRACPSPAHTARHPVVPGGH